MEEARIFRCGAAVRATTVPDIGLFSIVLTNFSNLAAVAGGKETSWLQGKSN